jgi:hypothetical protein
MIVVFAIHKRGTWIHETTDPSEAYFWQCMGYEIAIPWISTGKEWMHYGYRGLPAYYGKR